ncbi:MAG: acetyl-CoA carboxylase carboxyl transferase subunit alpha/beta [Proteobacteria bacterium]|nr:acetyl-CoA carboxylase carboxyl transferase subunit alpha/beta [Pseudomonadota bacterium]
MELVDVFKKRTRHPFRPRSSDIIGRIFGNFRRFPTPGDSLIMGETDFLEHQVYVVAQEKPKPEKLMHKADLRRLNYGMLTADEHSRILWLMSQLKRQDNENAYLVTFVDTYGADISMESARRFQAFFIAHLIREFLTVPIRSISIVLGEGGSGGALAIQVCDRRAAIEDTMYATAPPESLAAIIFRDASRISDALAISRPTPRDIRRFQVVDAIIPQTRKVDDADGLAANIRSYLTRTIRELSKIKIKKLMKEREKMAVAFGRTRSEGRFEVIRRLIERPFSLFHKPPPDIQVLAHGSVLNLADDYGDGNIVDPRHEYIKCGEGVAGGEGAGCGRLIRLKEYLENHQVCPFCGKRHVLDASGWINCLTDPGTFHEINRNLTVDDLLEDEDIIRSYREFLAKQQGRTPFKESLVTAEAQVYGIGVVMAICEFYFGGGSMGVVFGEKFHLAAEHAIQKRLPFISVCCSGGARLYEGIPALMQMVKTIDAVNRIKRHGLPYISILGDPSTGGAIASFAALGDVILSEPEALIVFTGPRVMQARGFEVDEALIHSDALAEISAETFDRQDYFHSIRGIHEVASRRRLRAVLAKYLELYRNTAGARMTGVARLLG